MSDNEFDNELDNEYEGGGGGAVVFSHNRDCDNNLWFGRLALDGFESYVDNDFIMDPGLFHYYEEVIENFWPAFIEDSSYS